MCHAIVLLLVYVVTEWEITLIMKPVLFWK